MAAQERLLGEKLADIVLHLEEPDWLKTHLPALGARHAERYRVTPDMFEPIATTLIATLEDAVGGWGDRREELRREWSEALGAVAALMLEGFPAERPPA